ncbi:hypothetical protein AVO42_00510 [Thiomicrospira sp. XS5]|uniref:hypothetical protein n=1 Tax=Thiomicrospira sp. XS5 TaxID=1775636 RepID=UPI00074629EC|nr:hypothetical protein [Thiomicrospira sp. XS5]KUJ73938.1 hypothetical protein AVO42_00510 [Thiomicrospira sp. XS5]
MKRIWLILLAPLLVMAWLVWALKYIWAIIFDPDHAWVLAMSKDQLANAAFNGDPDETISSRAGRHNLGDKDQECWSKILCWLLNHIEKDHCELARRAFLKITKSKRF